MLSKIGALIHVDPEQAKRMILDAFRESGGNRAGAAEALGLSNVRSLYRWIDRLDMYEAIEKQSLELGHPVAPGPPRKKDRIRGALVEARGNVKLAARKLGMDEGEVLRSIESS